MEGEWMRDAQQQVLGARQAFAYGRQRRHTSDFNPTHFQTDGLTGPIRASYVHSST